MAREYKFRGRRIDNGEWAYGYYVKTPITTEFECDGQFLDSGTGRHCIIQNGVAHEVDHETVGQYVGNTDKIGVEIYEGDILKYEGESRVVVYEVPIFELQKKDTRAFSWDNWEAEFSVVIGNIHENPELLTK